MESQLHGISHSNSPSGLTCAAVFRQIKIQAKDSSFPTSCRKTSLSLQTTKAKVHMTRILSLPLTSVLFIFFVIFNLEPAPILFDLQFASMFMFLSGKSSLSYEAGEDFSELPVGVALHGLTKMYGDKTAIQNLNVNFHEGHVTSLLGHNGAGKTTTMYVSIHSHCFIALSVSPNSL